MDDAATGVDSAAPGPVGVDSVPVDGRTARAQRTREAIVEACLARVSSGDVRPTAPRIAEEAGVSVRSVFQHFDDLETLYSMVAERSVAQVADLLRPIPTDLPFATRLERVVAQRADLLEAITPVRRAAAVHAPESPSIRAHIAAGHDFLRSELDGVFAPELEGRAPARREQLLDMLDVATTWASWDVLRTLDGRTRDEAGVIMAAMIRVILEVPE